MLAHALYLLLEPVNRRLAQLALRARLGEAFIVGAVLVVRFALLEVYVEAGAAAAVPNDQLQILRSLMVSAYGAGFAVWMLFFSPRSTLFFYLFYASG